MNLALGQNSRKSRLWSNFLIFYFIFYQQFSKKFNKSRLLSTIVDKIRWFENSGQNQDCFKINREFQEFFLPKSRFKKFLTRIEIFQKLRPKSRFSKFFYQNRDFPKIWTNMEIVSKTLTKIKIFRLFFLGKSWFFENFEKIEIFESLG